VRDEFYVGWEAQPPPGIARHARRCAAALLAAAALAAVVLALAQGRFAASRYEFGTVREFVGWVREAPQPHLVVAAPGFCPAFSPYLLARAGTKAGARDLVAGLDGRLVRLRGMLVYRGDQTMVDVVPGSVEPLGGGGAEPAPDPGVEDLGLHHFTGEVVDSKCYFGVMNPGTGKVHRACAARCISSGTPPLLLVRDRDGRALHLLLVGEDGRALRREILDRVGEPVAVSGRVVRYDNLLVLHAAPEALRRL
jgi:hypothetical protein